MIEAILKHNLQQESKSMKHSMEEMQQSLATLCCMYAKYKENFTTKGKQMFEQVLLKVCRLIQNNFPYEDWIKEVDKITKLLKYKEFNIATLHTLSNLVQQKESTHDEV